MTYRDSNGMLARAFVMTLALTTGACQSDDSGGGGSADAGADHDGSSGAGGSGGSGGSQGGSGGSTAGTGGAQADAGGDASDAGAGGDAGTDAADSGGDAASGDGGDANDACTLLELGRGRLFFNAFGELTGIRYPVTQALGDPQLPDYVLIELYDSTTPTETGMLPPLVTGDFDLSIAPDDRLVTCQHCVSLVTDVTEGTDPFGFPIFEPARWYYGHSGLMQLDEVHDPLNAAVENTALLGSVHDVELAEVDQDDPAFPEVTGGGCFQIGEAIFDTRPTPGKDCEDLDDCGNELLEVCDPATLRCVDEIQCTIDAPCATDAFCIQQSPVNWWGACYPRCTPFASGSCPDGFACVQYGISDHDGYCLKTGDAAVGAACETKDATTDCTADAVCLNETCVAQCGYFSGTQSCSGATSCDVLGHCLSFDGGDPANLGEQCQSGVELASPCALNGNRFEGICFGYFPDQPYVCGESCLVDANDYDGDADDGIEDLDCAPEEFCALRFGSGLGICLPDPVCGDGAFGEMGEVCDDGNTQNGDGCSADCQTVGYAKLCAGAIDLPLNGTVSGTTAGGIDGFMASCQVGIARGRLYTINPPGPGQLEIFLTSDTTQVASVRSDCAAPLSEIGCGYSFPSEGVAALVTQLTGATAPLTLLVTAATVIEEGPFNLMAVFTPQVCGDGLIHGSEVCDDGNTQSGDGCSADCSTVEYENLCGQATALTLDVTVPGETGGQYSLYTPTCGDYGTGADDLYQITAPATGTLTVSVSQSVDGTTYTDLAVFVLDSCGSPAAVNELACSSVYDPEVVTLDVTQGQTVFVVVDSLASAGPYEITAHIE